MKKIFYLVFLFSTVLFAQYSNKALIILNNQTDNIKVFAALELKKHLDLVLKENVLIESEYTNQDSEYIFFIGTQPYKETLNKNQSNYEIINNKIYLFGDDSILKNENTPLDTVLNMKNRVGTLFSVYDFLYNELGIRWIKSGDEGIIYKELNNLNFTNKFFLWNSDYNFTILRDDIWDYDKFVNKLKMERYTPKDLRFSQSEVEIKEKEDLLWKRRMKLDSSLKPNYGHAFTKYWDKYGDEHPEWFALGENGKRGVNGFPKLEDSRQKFCVSNIFLQDEIVNNWKKEYEKNGNNIYNASINDSRGYCTCDSCKLLDLEDAKHHDFQEKEKTERYVYFWNSLLKKAKDFNPNAKLIAYAYSDYRYPPQKIKLSEDIILGFVPQFNDLPNETKMDLEAWKEKGLKEVFLRPNDFNDDIGLPMGHEKFIFEKFKVFKDTKLLGIDHDNAYSFNDWNFEGIGRYILIQSFNNPNKSFEELENEYYEIYGSSKNDIKEYYKYWRDNFENKRLPFIKNAGGFEGRKFLYENIKNFYTTKDFENTNKILENALNNTNSGNIKNLIESMIISNNHAKLIFETFSQKEDFTKNYKELSNFRIKYKDSLSLCWAQVFNTEERLNNNDYLKKIYSKVLDNFE